MTWKMSDQMRGLTIEERAGSGVDDLGSVDAWFRSSGLSDERQEEYIRAYTSSKEAFAKRISPNRKDDETLPLWCRVIDKVLQRCGAKLKTGGKYVSYEAMSLDEVPFEDFYSPFVTYVIESLPELGISSYFAPELKDAISDNVLTELVRVSLLTLFHDYKESGLGHEDYTAQFLEKEYFFEIFNTYPVLARTLAESVENYIQNVGKILRSYMRDEDELKRSGLLKNNDEKILSISSPKGDRHRGGKAVVSLDFSETTLYYRPQSSPEISNFNQIIGTVGLELPSLLHLNREDHCWVAEARYAGKGACDLGKYFYQLGELGALFFCLGSKDMHFENIVATTDGPIAIDLETLLAPTLYNEKGNAEGEARDFLNDSPLGTGIFPVSTGLGDDEEFDVSAIISGLGATTKVEVTSVIIDHDVVSLEKKVVERGVGESIPDGVTIDEVKTLLPAALAGFRSGISLLRDNKDQLVAELTEQTDTKYRVIIRPTSLYDTALRALSHPKFMVSMLARENFLLRLWKEPQEERGRFPGALVASEVRQLLANDVPMFHVIANSNAICDGERQVAICERSPHERLMSTALERATSRSRADRDEQLLTEALNAGLGVRRSNTELGTPKLGDPPVTHLHIHSLIDMMYQKFLESSFVSSDNATWIGFVSSRDSKSLRLAPVGTSLYDGISGIAVALAAFYRVSGDASARTIVEACISRMIAELSELRKLTSFPVGAYSGISGILYAINLCSKLIEIENNFCEVNEDSLCELVTNLCSKDKYLDITSGASGALLVMSTFVSNGTWGNIRTTAHIAEVTESLCQQSCSLPGMEGLAWQTGDVRVPLGGMSHGVSGIGMALAKSATITRSTLAGHVAEQALLFDDNYYDRTIRLWRDMRPESLQDDVFPNHWCHGAAGIALARGAAASFIETKLLRQLTSQATESFKAANYPDNHSLCHGLFGNMMCAAKLDSQLCGDLRNAALNSLFNGKPIPGIDFDVVEVPGLMIGHAGIIYSLCTLLDDALPNILLLD